MVKQLWNISILVDGESVLSIGDDYVSGRADLHLFEDSIRKAVESVLSFIGDKQKDYNLSLFDKNQQRIENKFCPECDIEFNYSFGDCQFCGFQYCPF